MLLGGYAPPHTMYKIVILLLNHKSTKSLDGIAPSSQPYEGWILLIYYRDNYYIYNKSLSHFILKMKYSIVVLFYVLVNWIKADELNKIENNNSKNIITTIEIEI